MLATAPPAPIVGDLRVLQRPDGAAVELRLHAAAPHPLSWTLEADTETAGGHSRTRQSGTATGDLAAPVARLWIGPKARGLLSLSVSDTSGLRLRKVCSLGPTDEKGTPAC